MRIALIGPTYPFRGGISHYTTLLYRELKKRHEVRLFSFKRQYPSILFPGKNDKDSSDEAIIEPGAQPVLDSMNPITWLLTVNRVRRFAPDLTLLPWWVSFWTPQFLVVCSLVKLLTASRVAFLCHNVNSHDAGAIDKLCTRIALQPADGFLVHSLEDEARLARLFPGRPTIRVHHPVYDVFRMRNLSRAEARARLGLSGNVLLFFGFIRPYKGLRYLIRAMPLIMKNTDVTLMVVGEFWSNETRIRSLAERLGVADHVRFVGRYVSNEDVEQYFAASDLVVLPYVSATGSGIVQTAYAMGRPVLATRVGCLPEVVEHGRTGYLVEKESPQAICAAVVDFFMNGRARQMAPNLDEMRAKFSWSNLVTSIEELARRAEKS
ncbi:MAG: glycosyltransferase [Planctomycetes bacterium]|nr:glycosyltransferase [Planctomycetota bacterium]